MSKKETVLNARKRDAAGSSVAGRMRRSGRLPAALNMGGGESVALDMEMHEMDMFLKHHTGEHVLVDLVIEGGGPVKALLNEVQHHPVTDRVLHADFKEVSMSEKLQVTIPVELTGDPKGVMQGGVLEQELREVEVECLPSDLPETLVVDVSGLDIGQHITVSEMNAGENVVILTDGELLVAAVMVPRTAETDETDAGEEGDAKEPEVIKKKKEEEPED